MKVLCCKSRLWNTLNNSTLNVVSLCRKRQTSWSYFMINMCLILRKEFRVVYRTCIFQWSRILLNLFGFFFSFFLFFKNYLRLVLCNWNIIYWKKNNCLTVFISSYQDIFFAMLFLNCWINSPFFADVYVVFKMLIKNRQFKFWISQGSWKSI